MIYPKNYILKHRSQLKDLVNESSVMLLIGFTRLEQNKDDIVAPSFRVNFQFFQAQEIFCRSYLRVLATSVTRRDIAFVFSPVFQPFFLAYEIVEVEMEFQAYVDLKTPHIKMVYFLLSVTTSEKRNWLMAIKTKLYWNYISNGQ